MSLSVVQNWIRQPSSVTGLSALCATAAGILSGHLTPSAAFPAVVFAVVAILLPDNTAVRDDARRLAGDLVVLSSPGEGVDSRAPLANAAASPVVDLGQGAGRAPHG